MKLLENAIDLNVRAKDGTASSRSVIVRKLCFGRYCGRDPASSTRWLETKRLEGFAVHAAPDICRTSSFLLTNDYAIEVQGPRTYGEVEIVAIIDKGEVLISVGSDHDDVSLETMWTETLGKVYDSAKTKQMCPSVIASDAWLYADIRDHWNELGLRSWVTLEGERALYQDFVLGRLMDLEYHFQSSPWLREDGVVFFGGSAVSLPDMPSNAHAPDFHLEAHDPVLNRTISHSYEVRCLDPQSG